MAGGNDSNNLIIPTLASQYNNYAAIRTPVLALPQNAILPVTSLNPDGNTYGLHPSCPELQTLFGEGKLAFLFNTGTLIYPITRAQYLAGTMNPPQLFSHADQVTQWQTSVPEPAANHRLGRALRRPPRLRATGRAHFTIGDAQRRQHLRSRQHRHAVFRLHRRRDFAQRSGWRPFADAHQHTGIAVHQNLQVSRPTPASSSMPSTRAGCSTAPSTRLPLRINGCGTRRFP